MRLNGDSHPCHCLSLRAFLRLFVAIFPLRGVALYSCKRLSRQLFTLVYQDLAPLLAELVEDLRDLLRLLLRRILDGDRSRAAPDHFFLGRVIGVDDQGALGIGVGGGR